MILGVASRRGSSLFPSSLTHTFMLIVPFNFSLLDGKFERPRNGKKNDKAHPPIHPTAHVNSLTGDDKRVYDLVVRRFLACCSTNARGMETTVEIEIAGEGFTAHGLSAASLHPVAW